VIAVNTLGLAASRVLAGRLSTTIAPQRQLRATLLKLTVLTGALVVQTVFVLPSLVGSAAARWSTLLLIFAASTIGAVPGNAATMAMAPVPATAGTGSALMGGSTILARGTCPRW
jgi:DHA1 family bicyclomycin/chloramphenicol resistance-like MFS transporter